MVAALGAVFLLVELFWKGGAFLFPGPENYDEIGLWVFYILFAAAVPFLFIMSKDIKWDSYIGEISYPMYLVHGFIIGALHAKNIIGILAVTILISIALYMFVDRPVDRFRHRLAALPKDMRARRPVYKQIRFQLASVGVVLFLMVSLQPHVTPPLVPYLMKAVGNYNIVKLGEKFYGIPQGIRVNWHKDDLKAIRGMVIDNSMEKTEAAVRTLQEGFPR